MRSLNILFQGVIKKVVIAAVVGILLTLIAFSDFFMMRPAATEATGSSWSPVRPAAVPTQILLNGLIRGAKTNDLVAPFDGTVKAAFAYVGAPVAAGAPLLEFDDSAIRILFSDAKLLADKASMVVVGMKAWRSSPAYRSAQRQLANDESAAESADRKHTDTKRLFDQGIVSREEFEQALMSLRSAKTQLESSRDAIEQLAPKPESLRVAEAELSVLSARAKALQEKLNKSQLFAPAAGVVTTLGSDLVLGGSSGVVVGQKLIEGTLVARVVDLSKFQVVGHVSESSIQQLSVGLPAIIVPASEPEKRLKGKLSIVSPLPTQNQSATVDMGEDARPARFQVVIDVLPEDGGAMPSLRVGTNAEVKISTSTGAQGLLVDLSAVRSVDLSAGTGRLVVRSGGGPSKELSVKVGKTSADGVHVFHSDLKVGDEVQLSTAVQAPKSVAGAVYSEAVPVRNAESGTSLLGGVRALLQQLMSSGS